MAGEGDVLARYVASRTTFSYARDWLISHLANVLLRCASKHYRVLVTEAIDKGLRAIIAERAGPLPFDEPDDPDPSGDTIYR